MDPSQTVQGGFWCRICKLFLLRPLVPASASAPERLQA